MSEEHAQFAYPEEVDAEVHRHSLELSAEFIGQVMDWVCEGPDRLVARRARALLWMVNPARFGSQTEMAKAIGASKKVLNTTINSFRDRFGYVLPNMRSDDVRKKYSQAKTNYHASKRAD